ncbi:unnamed protein product [Vitrella brassicaformis CCMP3155]|uniref:FAD-binding domain-containing protein n=1 Tax=Vitrella brassicaformis (strain CCMP3155) TaxID=1169540 RepID=A0A0G4GFK0_VITBC|nr:unnamed protein product [Vitrella brassicaformis CCMP3155]|eukprot:CEM28299.1 unnamed protein product [Vitrella brassicaformis CCMP3155]
MLPSLVLGLLWTAICTAEEHTRLRVLVVGGGIGGLAAGKAAKNHGHSVQIFESRQRHRYGGVNYYLWRNGLNALKELGISTGGLGLALSQVRFFDADGKLIRNISLDASEPPWGVDVPRRALLSRLQRPMRRHIHFGKEVAHIECRPMNVSVTFADGTTAEGDVLIGADGCSSTVRRLIFPEAPQPQEAPATSIGGLIELSPLHRSPPARLLRECCRGRAFDYYLRAGVSMLLIPCAPHTVGWVFCVHEALERRKCPHGALAKCTPMEWKTFVEGQFRGFSVPMVSAVLSYIKWGAAEASLKEAGDAHLATTVSNAPVLWRWYDLPELPSYSSDGAVLIGDAAHCLLPTLGLGANSAIEDAVLLFETLRHHGFGDKAAGVTHRPVSLLPGSARLREGLSAYSELRRPRMATMRLMGRKELNKIYVNGPLGNLLRWALLRCASDEAVFTGNAQLYGGYDGLKQFRQRLTHRKENMRPVE